LTVPPAVRALRLLGVLLCGSCATLQQNIAARENLKKCKYELEAISLRGVHLDGLKVETVDLDVHLRVTNTTDQVVAFDRVDAEVTLDDTQIAEVVHTTFVRIAPGESVVEPVHLSIPLAEAASNLGRLPDEVVIKGLVYPTMIVGDEAVETSVVIPITRVFRIPYDDIEAKAREMGGELFLDAAEKHGGEVLKKLGF